MLLPQRDSVSPRPVRRTRRVALTVATAALVAAVLSTSDAGVGSVTRGGTDTTSVAYSAEATAASETLSAVNAFLATLSSTQQSTVQASRSQSNLSQWSNLPDGLFTRAGLRMDTLSSTQQSAVLAILQAALSDEGYEQVTGITTADGVLHDTTGSDDYGSDHYWIRILGTPSSTGQWTVQYGGHHLAVNITLTGDTMTLAPTLFGVQPATYTLNGVSYEPLAGETDKAFAVIQSLDSTQLAAAVLDTAVTEIILGAGQDGKTLAYEGVQASTFTTAQKTLLLDLVTEWISPLNDEQAASKLESAEANLDSTYFAWSGSTSSDQPIYYRVQSPDFTIEFAHQQNMGGTSHIHAIYRETGNDYGAGD
ncbi:DUF3500 domain-containing protein [Streptomyces sp. NPDC047461]|uniref:DUF3500 domain-containing protein n=1 Tax=Streptomyces sp. NPDC047461 TaxID=3155619 RepID=UPI003409C6FD